MHQKHILNSRVPYQTPVIDYTDFRTIFTPRSKQLLHV